MKRERVGLLIEILYITGTFRVDIGGYLFSSVCTLLVWSIKQSINNRVRDALSTYMSFIAI